MKEKIEIRDRSAYIQFRKYPRLAQFNISPKKIVLHHTVSDSILGTERYLESTPYGYHFMISKEGVIHQYVDPGKFACNHAKGANRGTVGISFVCGGKFGPVNDVQREAYVKLAKYLKNKYPSITQFTGHKDLPPVGRKIDPRWPGEPANGVRWIIHIAEMEKLEKETGLRYVR